MTAKEKAFEIYDNCLMVVGGDWNGKAKAKKLSLISANEIINELEGSKTYVDYNSVYSFNIDKIEFYQKVKQEIELL